MPIFDTPEPIFAAIELADADVRIHASDRTDTVVEIRPKDESDEADARSAAQTQVEYSNGRLLVRAPKSAGRPWSWWGGSTEVRVELPSGSRVDARTAGDFRCEGRLGECAFSTSGGDIWLDRTGRLRLHTGDGDITVIRAGHTDATTANGEIRIREIDGSAVIKTANGDITLGEVTGDLRLKTAYGDITVGRALAGVGARTATGNVRVGELVRGAVVLETSSGDVEAGVREGTAAFLDVRTSHGTVRVSLDPCDGPGPAGDTGDTVELRARTSNGDIVIRRS
ncbi:DUF4097 family beta strand repeat-containing protein [Sphaerisporangium corydalis]|uniref:DUF4097 domain-containing protein n=1 Tax=Sphaerisporangium corydalis TaxID=1441875 RepID=A0ABV9EHK1_9ACTN|nr:DUF4097 domain-containing protein [Sphaerisporangium corydalis]